MLLYTECLLEEPIMGSTKSLTVGEKLISVPIAHGMPENEGKLPL